MRNPPIHRTKHGLISQLTTVAIAVGTLMPCWAGLVTLQNATATFSQTVSGSYPASAAIDGATSGDNGWAIAVWEPGWSATDQTAVFETSEDINYPGAARLEFALCQNWGGGVGWGFTIGRFRLSVTTDDRSLFADGLSSGGDITANWTVLSPFEYSSLSGATMTKLGDDSILAGPPPTGTDTYTVVANSSLVGITGIRLEVLEDSSLPSAGPGYGEAGNFVLNEITLDASPVPEPGAFGFAAGLGLLGFIVARRVRG